MRSIREWLDRTLDPARRKLGLTGLVFCMPMAILWIGARLANGEPSDSRLALVSLIGQAGFCLGLAAFFLSCRNGGLRWLGALFALVAIYVVAVAVVLQVTGLTVG